MVRSEMLTMPQYARFAGSTPQSGGDPVAAAYLVVLALIIVAGVIAFVKTKEHPASYRAGVAVALGAAFLLSWVNPAVGIIGNEANPANLIFLVVIAVGGIGAVAARFRPGGMARALVATAVAQVGVGLIIWLVGWGFTLGINAFFAALWLASGWLFRKADRQSQDGRRNELRVG